MAGGFVQAVATFLKGGKDGETVQVSAANPLPVTMSGGGGGGSDATAANQVVGNDRIGTQTETAPASDTASSGLNGRLQRIAQRLTSLIALLPASLGAKTGAASLSIVPASDANFPLPLLPAGTDRSGSATTVSGALTVPANTSRRFLVGQNVSTVAIGFNEFGAAAVIGGVGTYTVPAGASFSVSTRNAVNFIAASGTAAVTMTEG